MTSSPISKAARMDKREFWISTQGVAYTAETVNPALKDNRQFFTHVIPAADADELKAELVAVRLGLSVVYDTLMAGAQTVVPNEMKQQFLVESRASVRTIKERIDKLIGEL